MSSIYYNNNNHVEESGSGITISFHHHSDATSKDKLPQQQQYYDYCVCTVPLGVLKQGRIHFDPPLPSQRLVAIESIGMGLLNKIVLKFDRRFWGCHLKRFGMAHDCWEKLIPFRRGDHTYKIIDFLTFVGIYF